MQNISFLYIKKIDWWAEEPTDNVGYATYKIIA